MHISALSRTFFLGAVAALALPLAARSAPAPSLQFDRIPLEDVVRIVSARFAATVTIAGDRRAPISGDFTALNLRQALMEAARQAGLVLVPGGPAGFCLVPADRAPSFDPAGAAGAAEVRRAELLKKRKDLLDQAALLTH